MLVSKTRALHLQGRTSHRQETWLSGRYPNGNIGTHVSTCIDPSAFLVLSHCVRGGILGGRFHEKRARLDGSLVGTVRREAWVHLGTVLPVGGFSEGLRRFVSDIFPVSRDCAAARALPDANVGEV